MKREQERGRGRRARGAPRPPPRRCGAWRPTRKAYPGLGDDLIDYWNRGAASRDDDRSVAAQAEELGWSETKVRKARQFASPAEGYGPDDLKRLSDLLLGHEGGRITVSAVGVLVTLKREDRPALERASVLGGWSKGRLEAEVRLREGRRRKGGRRRRVPDAQQALAQLDAMAESWARWLRAARGLPAEGGRSAYAGLPAKVREVIDGDGRADGPGSVDAAFRRLGKALERPLKRAAQQAARPAPSGPARRAAGVGRRAD